jgi:hypothetical protein
MVCARSSGSTTPRILKIGRFDDVPDVASVTRPKAIYRPNSTLSTHSSCDTPSSAGSLAPRAAAPSVAMQVLGRELRMHEHVLGGAVGKKIKQFGSGITAALVGAEVSGGIYSFFKAIEKAAAVQVVNHPKYNLLAETLPTTLLTAVPMLTVMGAVLSSTGLTRAIDFHDSLTDFKLKSGRDCSPQVAQLLDKLVQHTDAVDASTSETFLTELGGALLKKDTRSKVLRGKLAELAGSPSSTRRTAAAEAIAEHFHDTLTAIFSVDLEAQQRPLSRREILHAALFAADEREALSRTVREAPLSDVTQKKVTDLEAQGQVFFLNAEEHQTVRELVAQRMGQEPSPLAEHLLRLSPAEEDLAAFRGNPHEALNQLIAEVRSWPKSKRFMAALPTTTPHFASHPDGLRRARTM